jgi:hypothetical protein
VTSGVDKFLRGGLVRRDQRLVKVFVYSQRLRKIESSNLRLPNDWIHDGLLPVSRFRVTAMPCQDSNILAVRLKESRIIRHQLVHLLAVRDEEL